MRKRMEYTASLEREREKIRQKSAGVGQGGEEEEEEVEEAVEEGLGLGNSVLGRKKGGLKVPVADMLGRRESGSGRGY